MVASGLRLALASRAF